MEHFVIQLRGDLEYSYPQHNLKIFHTLEEILDYVSDDIGNECFDIEDDAIWVWKVSNKEKTLVWHCSGWHFSGCKEIEGMSQGILPGDDKPLYYRIYEETS
jgi:hypothetical protein